MRKCIGAVVIFLFTALGSSAQDNWGGGVDDEVLHFGFTFQYINSEFKVLKKPQWRTPFSALYPEYQHDPSETILYDSLYSVSSSGSPGFGLGFVSNLRLGNNADLRFTPTLVFADRLAYYEYRRTGQVLEKKVQSSVIDLPLGFKIKSDRRKNFRAYLLAGAKYSMDIISKKKLDDENNIFSEKLLKNKKNYLSYEAGIGFDLYFEYFKLSPEIKFSQSFNDVLKHDVTPFASPVDKLYLRNIQFSLYFE